MTAINLPALIGWHRARQCTCTLVTRDGHWTGVALVNRERRPRDWSLATLRQDGTCQAVAFPGWREAWRVALLDRDGTIIVDRNYLGDPDGVELLPGAAAGLGGLAALGIVLVVITNQSGIGSGRLTWDQVHAVNRRLTELLAEQHVTLAGTYACPHRADEQCRCRKPGDALPRRAASELGLSLSRAIVVGDKAADVGLARTLGAPAFLVTTGHGHATLLEGDVSADYVVDGLDDVSRIVGHPAGLAGPTDLPVD